MTSRPAAAASAALTFLLGAAALPAQTSSAPQEIALPKAVEVALKNNPTLQAADSYAEAVRHAVDGAKAGYFPRLDFSEGFMRSNNPVFVFSSLLTQRRFAAQDFALGSLNFPLPLDNFRTQFAASAPLYDAGQTSRRVKDARLDSQGAQRGADRTRQEVIYNVVNAYLNQLLARESVGVAEAAVKSTGEDLARAEARQAQGQALLSDVLSAKVQLAQANEDLIRARNEAAVAQAALDVAMGLPEDAPEQARGPLSDVAFEGGTLEERQRRALDLRPDYQQALLGKDKAANAIAGARAQFLPTVSLFSSWEQDNEAFAARGGNNWAAGATLNFNLFDGGARRAQLAESHARERQADALRAQMAAGIRLQVRQAYLNLTAARQRVDVSRDSASEAQESLSILRNRYESGLATITDVLNAEAAHARAQRDYLSAVYDDRIAYATLELATGELGPASQAVVR
ncbi:MAG TPA: TolC family protein [Terriglobia bacterium]|nr:TolC family protein [Terriglobia bacterium]